MSYSIGALLTGTWTADQLKNQGNAHGVGDRFVDGGGKVYKFVQYNTAVGVVAAVANQMAYYYAPGGVSAGATTVVTSDLSDSAGVGAGMLLAAPANGEYCWVQIGGPATLALALTAGADGNALTAVGSTDGALDVSALVTDHICAVAIDASAKIVLLTCPD